MAIAGRYYRRAPAILDEEILTIIQSAFIPAVKSILASNDEDEKKRREARRKSLGALRDLLLLTSMN